MQFILNAAAVIIYILVIVNLIFILLLLIRHWLPKEIVCDTLGWHDSFIDITGFNGSSFTGKCHKCGRNVCTDLCGDWVTEDNKE